MEQLFPNCFGTRVQEEKKSERDEVKEKEKKNDRKTLSFLCTHIIT